MWGRTITINDKIKDDLWWWGRTSASNLKIKDEHRGKWEGDLQVNDKCNDKGNLAVKGKHVRGTNLGRT